MTTSEILLDLAPHGSGFITETELIEMLPHGSGIDCSWRIEPRADGVDCFNSFHMMDENGSYCGYAEFSVRIFHAKHDVFNPLKGPCAGQIQVVQRKGDIDFKIVCRGNAWRRNVAYGLKDYLTETVGFSLEKILTHRRETIAAASV